MTTHQHVAMPKSWQIHQVCSYHMYDTIVKENCAETMEPLDKIFMFYIYYTKLTK